VPSQTSGFLGDRTTASVTKRCWHRNIRSFRYFIKVVEQIEELASRSGDGTVRTKDFASNLPVQINPLERQSLIVVVSFKEVFESEPVH
jgi:hypothetical protein